MNNNKGFNWFFPIAIAAILLFFFSNMGGESTQNTIDEEGFYIIIACEAVKYGNAKSLEEVRPEIERALHAEKNKGTLEKWMEGLRKRSVIKKFGW